MRAVIQRVSEAAVSVDGETLGEIGQGLVALLGVAEEDTEDDAQQMAQKIAGLRCFTDAAGKFNLSVEDIDGGILAISQFTLLGDCRKGRRPSFGTAARPESAIPLYEAVIEGLRTRGIPVACGRFGAHMDVRLVNDGPVTLLLDTRKVF